MFTIGAFFAGIAGALYASYFFVIKPDQFGFLRSIDILVIVVLGGLGSMSGTVIAAILLALLSTALQEFSDIRMILYSLMLVLIMIFRPQGIFGNWEFSLTKTINKLFYPMKVKAHGKSKQAESTAKAAKDTAKTDETVETAADTKEAQA